MDPMTGRSRGFAFLLYKDIESVVKAADGSEHQIKVGPGEKQSFCFSKTVIFQNKSITVKKADIKPGKVYVGKLPDTGLGEDEIREHFSQFGNIAEVIRPIDKSKNNEPKNFCFVTFERERVAKKLIEEGSCTINGHKMQVKQVTPNPRDPSHRGGGMGGGRGGYGASPWMNQGWGGGQGGWNNDGGYGQSGQWGGAHGGGGGQWGGNQWGNDYGGGNDMGWGGQAQMGWGGQGGGGGGGGGNTWSSGGGRGGGGRGGGGKMRGGPGGRGRGGRGGRGRPY